MDKDNKPTDIEIIKALECCTDGTGKGIVKATLDLINHLQAEKEVLEARIGVYETCNARKDEAIHRLEAENKMLQEINDSFTDIGKFYSEIKTETIKEFAEILKENLTGWDTDPTDEEIEYTINNLVKEKVSENNV